MYALIIFQFNIILIFNQESAGRDGPQPRRPRTRNSRNRTGARTCEDVNVRKFPGRLRTMTSTSCAGLFSILNLLKTTFLFNCRILLILYLVEFYNHISRALRPSYVSTFKYSWMYVSGGMIMNLIGFYKIRKKPKICEVSTQTVKIRRT